MDTRRDRIARRTEVGSTAVAGTVGSMLGAAKLRDAYKKDYPKRFAAHAASAEHAATTVAPKAGRLARIASHGEPGFITLAVGTGAAGLAAGSRGYRKHRDKLAKKEPPIPRSGYVKGIGKVRVMHYNGNGHFWVLDRKDTKRLVHRKEIRFSKADSSHRVLVDAADLDTRVRTLKRKTLPSGIQVVARVGDRTRMAIANEQAKLSKAYDPHRTQRRRERGAEGLLAAGSAGAAIGSVRATQAGRGHLRAASTHASTRDRSFASAVQHSRTLHEDLPRYAASMKSQHGKGVNASALRDAATMHSASYRNLRAGAAAHGRAIGAAHEGAAAFRRARNLRGAALGLAAGAAVAHHRVFEHRAR